MRNKSKYNTYFTNFDAEHKYKFSWLIKTFLIIFIIACTIYLLVSIVALFLISQEIEMIFTKIGELASILISMALSFISLFFSAKFEGKVNKLVSSIKSSNENLNFDPFICDKKKYKSNWILIVSIVLSIIIFLLVIINIVLQLMIVCGVLSKNILMSKMIASIVLTLLTVGLSGMTIWDYIVLTNNMTIDLNEIEHQNHQLFNR